MALANVMVTVASQTKILASGKSGEQILENIKIAMDQAGQR